MRANRAAVCTWGRCMGGGFVMNEVFDRLHVALQLVESIEGIAFATSTKYGYVTSCPSNLGTGMRASVHLKVRFQREMRMDYR